MDFGAAGRAGRPQQMRKIVIRLSIVVVFIVTISILWIFAGRHLSLLVDRVGTIETVSQPIKSISYEGSGVGGLLQLNDLALSLTTPNQQSPSPNIGTTKDEQLALSFGGKVFAFGPLRSGSENLSDNLAAGPATGDDATIATSHSALSWPTLFDFNFMTGRSPSWKRHLYCRLDWKKQNGAKLEMLWRFEQYFYSGDGWVGGLMTREGATGLIRVTIQN
jgi:hypothetical protein